LFVMGVLGRGEEFGGEGDHDCKKLFERLFKELCKDKGQNQ